MLLNSSVAWNLSADMTCLHWVRLEKYCFGMFLAEEMLNFEDKAPLTNLSLHKFLSEAVAKGHMQQWAEKRE